MGTFFFDAVADDSLSNKFTSNFAIRSPILINIMIFLDTPSTNAFFKVYFKVRMTEKEILYCMETSKDPGRRVYFVLAGYEQTWLW